MPAPQSLVEASSPRSLQRAKSIAESQEAARKVAKASRLAERANISPYQKEAGLQAARERLDSVRASYEDKGVMGSDRATRESRAFAAFEALQDEFKDGEAKAVAQFARESKGRAGKAANKSQLRARVSKKPAKSAALAAREIRAREAANYINSSLGDKSMPARDKTKERFTSPKERQGPLWFLPDQLAPWRKRKMHRWRAPQSSGPHDGVHVNNGRSSNGDIGTSL